MTKKNDGGPAFPQHPIEGCYAPQGMTLRQYYAGQALNAVMTDPMRRGYSALLIAECVFEIADALIAAEKEPEHE
jgi:hypothetical protein